MKNYFHEDHLKGKFLISSPIMKDNRFYKTLILIIEQHAVNGTIGVVVNKMSAHSFLHIIKTIKHFDVNYEDDKIPNDINIVLGGPVNSNVLFVVHSGDYQAEDSKIISDKISMTNKSDIILDIYNQQGPKHTLIAIGCCKWTKGQLRQEISEGNWLVSDLDNDVLFHNHPKDLYQIAWKATNLHTQTNSVQYHILHNN